jgi:hypothetical protein
MRYFKKIVYLSSKPYLYLFLLSMPFLGYQALAQAQSVKSPQERILFIFDGSGSMWGRIDNQPKVDIAKEAISRLIRELPDNIEIGLLVYGHRVKGDCNDIETFAPVGQVDRNSLLKKLNAISPKGKTPISKSLELAAAQLEHYEEETTVILISDGKETCGGNPCKLVRDLKERGIKIKVHVVGFDVNREEREELICIADAGDGNYFTANNTFQLTNIFRSIKQQLRKKSCTTRNPFCVRDVPSPFDESVWAFNRKIPSEINKADPNAEDWAESKFDRNYNNIEGYWLARWNGGSAGRKWIGGTAEIRVVQNKVYILYKDKTSTYLTEAKIQNDNRIVGKYVNINYPNDSTPWVGTIIDEERIDGHWANGRWDYRR